MDAPPSPFVNRKTKRVSLLWHISRFLSVTWVTVRAGIDRCRLRRGCAGLRPVGEKRQLSDSASPWRSVGATGLKFGFKLSWWFMAEHRTTSALGVVGGIDECAALAFGRRCHDVPRLRL